MKHKNNKRNFVDERFELLSVIFRLAGNWEYNIGAGSLENVEYPFPDEKVQEIAKCDVTNVHQLEIVKTFLPFIDHEAVIFARNSGSGYGDVFTFAMHIEKKGEQFVFLKDISSLFVAEWNIEKAERFLPLLNKFYQDTDYATFYSSQIPYYEEISRKFYEDYYHTVDFDWYNKYLDASNLHCVLSPSNSAANYATIVNKDIFYCLVRISQDSVVIHEYNHIFANPIAEKWYKENQQFRKWIDDSINIEKMPYYPTGIDMAREYVTIAYEILYDVQHGGDAIQLIAIAKDRLFADTFPYIGEIYEMVLALEK